MFIHKLANKCFWNYKTDDVIKRKKKEIPKDEKGINLDKRNVRENTFCI